MPTIRFPFHHAVQHEQGSADRTIYSGNVAAGYPRQNHYNDISLISPHSWFDLYYEVPADAYKYTFNGYAKPVFDISSLRRVYTKTHMKASGNDYYAKEDSSNTNSNYTFPSQNGKPMTTHLSPGAILNSPFYLTDYDFTIIQSMSSQYLDAIMNGYWGFTPEALISSSDDYELYQKTSVFYTFNDIENSYIEFEATPVSMIISPVYPVDVYARKDRSLIVDWDISNNASRDEQYFYQTSNLVTITDGDGHTAQKGVVSGTASEVTFSASDLTGLSIGECNVHVEVTSNYNSQSFPSVSTADFTFDLIGSSDAPVITNVTQNSYPTITWTSTNQISWELQISNSEGIVYKSGMVIGNDTSFTVPKLLEDGGYSVELRYVNTYGSLSMWGSAFVNLQPTKPTAPQDIVVSARNDFGVSVSCSPMQTTGKLLVVRRKDENSTPVVLGEYNGSFVDYLVGLNDYHQYTVRNYVQGYADGRWIDGVVLAEGCVIRSADDYSKFVHIWKTQDNIPDYIISESKSDVLMNCVGRKYPITEIGEWVSSERSFSGHVDNDGFKKLIDMRLKASHVLLQADKEYMPCSMEMADRGQYIGDGRIASLKLTRIDGEK